MYSLDRLVIAILVFFSCLVAGFLYPAHCQSTKPAEDPEAYLRWNADSSSPSPRYYVEVYMKKPLGPGHALQEIRAALRDIDQKKLLATTVMPSTEGNSNFRMPISATEASILSQVRSYVVFVDNYPIATGSIDAQVNVALDVGARMELNAACLPPYLPVSITVTRSSAMLYATSRMESVKNFLDQPNVGSFMSADVITAQGHSESRTVNTLSKSRVNRDARGIREMFTCVQISGAQPAGQYDLSVKFLGTAPVELHVGQLKAGLQGGAVPSATNKTRDLQDFLDLGLTLTSSVKDQTQPNKTVQRVRTSQGAMDLWFAPILNARKVKAVGAGGVIQVFTPFYIDAKIATGKITKDTLSLNLINLGSVYEFRDYLNTHDYPDLLRNSLKFVHTSDRDFKQTEIKFTYELQPIFGVVNKPLNSAPNIFDKKPVQSENDKFGLQILPLIGVELGRTYRVGDPKTFAGTSRNVRRIYFGGDMIFDLTKYVKISLADRFYLRGENPTHRDRNYFLGSLEAPLSRIGIGTRLNAAHALVLSFERGDQPPFTNPSVNVFKIGYRIRARGLLINNQ